MPNFICCLRHILHGEGFEARLAATEDDAAEACTSAAISAVLLDCAGWPSDIAPVCALSKEARLPVGALAGGEHAQHLQLIKAGLEDVIARPLSPAKLIAFLNSVRPRPEPTISSSFVIPADLVVQDHAVVVAGKRINLAPIEARILEFLVARQGEISTREQLIEAVWPNPRLLSRRTVDVHVGRLRRAVAELRNVQIRTVYGAGYAVEFHDA
ncbi:MULTISPECIES: winged helix-turn-helix transcriptional regulator [Rhizobium]|uniref:winged helix-turn-helix transcriptional regulator n=1 Tax=Rhizobium TaxID=379 RepID=UPI0007F0C3E9|nr:MULTISPECIES: response regulator transcription factor [Rhizobium]ANK95507.1 response regulator protein [Rhizobium sp. N6212]ANL01559.1 response regulator protein [Rhizobium sp. N621]ANL07687.1 response regulator domain-containing protein [Rhizobium esperanzae]ANL13858.1 response regulator protein [Rhizobium sp. N1341]ANL25841.1 response regulator protein [Rhizobium sp. N113]